VSEHGHGHGHGGVQDAEDVFSERAWEERYGAQPTVWSGRPNPQLVAEAADLAPGTAVDVGSGEGADAIWLAERGWRVVGLDFATAALRRAAAHAAERGPEVAARIDWVHHDVTTWEPGEQRFDLVSAQFMHLPPAARVPLFARLADAVAPGGDLLIVGHDVSDLATAAGRPAVPEMFFTAEEVAATLDPDRWEVLVAESRPRTVPDPDRTEITVHDAVLRARRRG
jgi:SAM-dependent methyltransferase